MWNDSLKSFVNFSNNSKFIGDNEFSIISYNVRLFNIYNWIEKDNVTTKIKDFLKNKNADNRYFKTFRLEEVNSLGKWSNNHVNLFIYQQFDFLIYPDLNLIPEMENILINSYSKCRIGFFDSSINLFEMILKSELEYDIDYRMNKLYKYLKKLK